MSHHHEDDKKHAKKHKKLLQFFKNRHTRDINLIAEEHALGRDLEKESEEEVRDMGARAARKGTEGAPGNVVWSAKLQDIRDKNTGRKRMAQERWNRFAGTEGGGGRGL